MIFTTNINDQNYRVWVNGAKIDIEIPKVSHNVTTETAIKAKIQAIAGARFIESSDELGVIILKFGVDGDETVRENALRSLGLSDEKIDEVVRPRLFMNHWPDDDLS